jgi:hypothetical protein
MMPGASGVGASAVDCASLPQPTINAVTVARCKKPIKPVGVIAARRSASTKPRI